MKYISEELSRNYKKLIVIFFISYIGIIGFYSSYMYKNIKNQIRTVETFINYEFLDFRKEVDFEGESPKVFFEEALDESPKPERTMINLEYEGVNYFYMPNKFIKDRDNLNKNKLSDLKKEHIKNILEESNKMLPSNKIRNYVGYKYKIL
ncbi:MAG: hypothetical protein Q7K48_08270 [Fusobacterium sp. JB021]|nr:hypothetical protein [Fusobacterium sp. JB021]